MSFYIYVKSELMMTRQVRDLENEVNNIAWEVLNSLSQFLMINP